MKSGRLSTEVNGAGVGLRPIHIPYILEHRPPVPWFEIIIDNYLYGETTDATRVLTDIRQDYPLALHSVGLDVGSTDPIDSSLLKNLRARVQELEPAFVSTHLCWTASDGIAHHELLPLPFTLEAVRHCADRIQKFQDILGDRILIENISTYMRFAGSNTGGDTADDNQGGNLSEGEFLRAVAETADCYILLDVNNLYINHRNHHETPTDLDQFFATVPADRIRQFHLAGYEDCSTHLLDTHGAPVSSPVWELFARAIEHWGPRPVCIERDTNIPPDFQELYREAQAAGKLLESCG